MNGAHRTWPFLIVVAIVFLHVSLAAQESTSPHLTGPYLGQDPPGNTPVLFAPGIVSTGKEHSAAMFTPDGTEMWFGRMFPGKVYYMTMVDDVWSNPKLAPFTDDNHDLYPVLGADGNTVLFSSVRPINSGGQPLHRSGGEIWKVTRTKSGWSRPIHLGRKINFVSRHSPGSVNNKGDIYFTAFLKETSADLFVSRFNGESYTDPVSITELNSSEPEHSPYVAPDGSYIIFSSFHNSIGRSDLFISFGNDGGWSKPRNLGNKINSVWKDEYPYVTPDGKYLFFNSNRPSEINRESIPEGPGNIYWVDAKVIDQFRLKEIE